MVELGRSAQFASQSERVRAWKLAHPERVRELNRLSAQRRRERNPDSRKHELDFGLSWDQYADILEAQGGACAVCRTPAPALRRLAIDHDHSTGRIRGLLCRACNFAIGLLSDVPENFERAAAYLRNPTVQ